MEYVGKGTYQIVGLSNLIGGLFQPALGIIDTAVTVIDLLLHVAHVIELESPFRLVRRTCSIVLRLQPLAVNLRAGSEILLGIGEQIMRACSRNVGAANFGVCDRQLGIATLCASSNELIS